VHAPTEDKCDDIKDSFYEELEGVFDQFLKYHMKILLGDFMGRWEDNIKMDLGEIGFGDVDWIHCAQYRDRRRALVNTVMNLRVA
jgi:hypothetical protein